MKLLTKAKLMLWLFGHFKVPMIGFTNPKIIEISPERLIIKIKLGHRTKNHLNSMYMGALAVGADVAGGLLAVYFAQQSKLNISLAFKSFHADFIKRPETDVYFVCEQGNKIKQMLERAQSENIRINELITIDGFTHLNDSKEKVAEFKLGLSVKVKS